MSEAEACAEMKAIAEFIWWTEEHETAAEIRIVLEDLLRLSARAPDGIKDAVANYSEGGLPPESRYWRAKDGQTWPMLVEKCRVAGHFNPSPVGVAS